MMDRSSAAVDQTGWSAGDGRRAAARDSSRRCARRTSSGGQAHPWIVRRIHSFLLVVLHMMIVAAFTTTRRAGGTARCWSCSTILTHRRAGHRRAARALPRPRTPPHHPRPPRRPPPPPHLQGGDGGGAGPSPARAYPIDAQRGMDAFEWAAEVLPRPFGIAAATPWCPPLSTSRRSSRRSRPGCAVARRAEAAVDLLEPLNRLFVGKQIRTTCTSKLVFDAFGSPLPPQVLVLVHVPIAPSSRRRATCGRSTSAGCSRTRRWGTPRRNVAVLHPVGAVGADVHDRHALWFMLGPPSTARSRMCHIGEVPTTIIRRVPRAAENFNRKVLSAATPGPRVEPKRPPPVFAASSLDALEAGRSAPLAELRAALLPVTDELGNESLRYFAEAWNAIVSDMRSSDLLSNVEERRLLSGSGGAGVLALRLPAVLLHRGKLNEAFHHVRILADQAHSQPLRKRRQLERQLHIDLDQPREMREAVVEFCELGRWMATTLLGPRQADALAPLLASLVAAVERGEVLDTVRPSVQPSPRRRPRKGVGGPQNGQPGSASPRASAWASRGVVVGRRQEGIPHASTRCCSGAGGGHERLEGEGESARVVERRRCVARRRWPPARVYPVPPGGFSTTRTRASACRRCGRGSRREAARPRLARVDGGGRRDAIALGGATAALVVRRLAVHGRADAAAGGGDALVVDAHAILQRRPAVLAAGSRAEERGRRVGALLPKDGPPRRVAPRPRARRRQAVQRAAPFRTRASCASCGCGRRSAGRRSCGRWGDHARRAGAAAAGAVGGAERRRARGHRRQKFTYVASCQLYGQHKAKRDARRRTRLPAPALRQLRVAYVDEVGDHARRAGVDPPLGVLIKGAKEDVARCGGGMRPRSSPATSPARSRTRPRDDLRARRVRRRST